jgi:hypothetical protein
MHTKVVSKKTEGEKPFARPKYGWENSIQSGLKEAECETLELFYSGATMNSLTTE